jgi:hypothetical protein
MLLAGVFERSACIGDVSINEVEVSTVSPDKTLLDASCLMIEENVTIQAGASGVSTSGLSSVTSRRKCDGLRPAFDGCGYSNCLAAILEGVCRVPPLVFDE